MWRRVLCLCFTLPALTYALDPTKDNCLNSYGINDGRPRVMNIAISHEVALNGVDIPMARHHIIPYATLRNFFNAVVRYHDRTLHISLFTLIQRLGGIAQIDMPELNETEYELQFMMLRKTNDFLAVPFDYSHFLEASPYVQNMQALFAWMPFNIFEGPVPTRRSDDPGNNFEGDSGEIIGRDMLYGLRYLDTQLQTFISRPSSLAGLDTIRQINALLDTRQTPHAFNPNNWFVRHPLAGRRNARSRILFEIRTAENRVEQEQYPERLGDVTVEHPCFGGRHDVRPRMLSQVAKSQSFGVMELRTKKVITYCYVNFTLTSTVNNDPTCIKSMKSIVENVNKDYYFYDDKLWDLRDLDLLDTRNLTTQVDTFQLSPESSWKAWYHDHVGMMGALLIKEIFPWVQNSHAYCIARVVLRVFGIGSVCIAVTMALERYLALTRPFLYQKQVTYYVIRTALLVSWSWAAVLTCAPIAGLGLYYDEEKQECTRYRNAKDAHDFVYACVYVAFGTLLCLILVYCNLAVIRALYAISAPRSGPPAVRRVSKSSCRIRQQRSLTNGCSVNVPQHNAATAEEVAFSRLMATLSVLFMICWLPQMITSTLYLVLGEKSWPRLETLGRISDLLMLLNYVLDPILYVLMRKRRFTFSNLGRGFVNCFKHRSHKTSTESMRTSCCPPESTLVSENSSNAAELRPLKPIVPTGSILKIDD